MSEEQLGIPSLIHITEGIPPSTVDGDSGQTVIESELLPLASLLSRANESGYGDSACAMYAAALPAHFTGSLPEGTVLQLSPETGVVTVASIPGITTLEGHPIVLGEGMEQTGELLHTSNQEPIFGVLAPQEEETRKRNPPEIDLATLLTEEDACSDGEDESVSQRDEELAASQHQASLLEEGQGTNHFQDNSEEPSKAGDGGGNNPSVVTIDVTKPIQLCQNSLIVVNGQKCVLQHNPETGQVVAYPVKEPEKPRKKRGRPKKVVPETATDDEARRDNDDSDYDEEESQGSGMIHTTAEDGSLVRRSSRRRKKAKFLRDYETGNLKTEIGSDEEGPESEVGVEPETPPRKKGRGRGRPKKVETPAAAPQQFNPFPFLNPAKRGRGRPRRYGLNKDTMQGFLIQMADGQSLMMQIPSSSLPKDMTLQEVAQNIAQSLNAAAQMSPSVVGGTLPSTNGSGNFETPTNEIATSQSTNLPSESAFMDTNEAPKATIAVPSAKPPQTGKKRRGRPKKIIHSAPLPHVTPSPHGTNGPNIVLLSPTINKSPEPCPSMSEIPCLLTETSLPESANVQESMDPENAIVQEIPIPENASVQENPISENAGVEENLIPENASLAAAITESVSAETFRSAIFIETEEACSQSVNDTGELVQESAENETAEETIANAEEQEEIDPNQTIEYNVEQETGNDETEKQGNPTIPATVIPLPENLLPLISNKQDAPIKIGLKATEEELENFRCAKCDHQSFYQQQHQDHLVTHEGIEKCKCCSFVCLSEKEMIEHYKATHPQCICDTCNHTANCPYLIRRHMSQHNHNICTCDICGKKYKDNYILNMHVKLVHMPSNILFQCDLCLKNFNRKAHLKRHLRTHDPDKPYKCTHCNYRGCEKSDITKHMLIHQEPKYYCDICGKAFRHCKNKELHVKRHKGQRDYKCGVCEFYGYTFTDIRKHIERRHADAKTLICGVCGQAFKTEALLKEHQEMKQCEVYLIEDAIEAEYATQTEDDGEIITADLMADAENQCMATSITLSDGTVARLDSLPTDEEGHIVLNQEDAEALAQSGQLAIVTSDSSENPQVALITEGGEEKYEEMELQENQGTLISCGQDGSSQPLAVMTSDGLMLHVVV